MKKFSKNISIGALLREQIHKQQRYHTEVGISINRNRMSVSNYLKNESIQTSVLIEFCYALKHNFFRDIADQLPPEFGTNNSEDLTILNGKDLQISQKESQIQQLQEEIKVLKIKNELLMKIQGI